MSKYKITFWCDSGANIYSCNKETFDLIDDWNYTEEEAEYVLQNEEEQEKLLNEWLCNTVDQGIFIGDEYE